MTVKTATPDTKQTAEQGPPEKLVIATRASRLALWQAEHVRDLLQELYPGCSVELLELTTKGDQILDRSLSKVGGKGLFIKELEHALLDGRADLAVHSLKDVPMELMEEFHLAAILPRANPCDALVSPHADSLMHLKPGDIVGTSSLRREAQIRARYPSLEIKPLRGNLDTRLGKLDRGEYAAIVLAAAGLQRLNMADRIRRIMSPAEMLPAAGQGALAIETLSGRSQLRAWLQPLACADTTAIVLAERAVSRELGGSCQIPLGAYAELEEDTLQLRALVAEVDGSRILRAQGSGPTNAPDDLGKRVAEQLYAQGAQEILDRLNKAQQI